MFVTEVLRIRPGMQGADRNNKSQTIRRSDFTTAPLTDERDAVLLGNQVSIRFREGLVSNEVLTNPGQPGSPQSWNRSESMVPARYCRHRQSGTRTSLLERSLMLDSRSLICENFDVKSVLTAISNRTSGRSTRGSRAFTSSLSLIRLSGSSALSIAVTTSSGLPSTSSTRASGFDGRLWATDL